MSSRLNSGPRSQSNGHRVSEIHHAWPGPLGDPRNTYFDVLTGTYGLIGYGWAGYFGHPASVAASAMGYGGTHLGNPYSSYGHGPFFGNAVHPFGRPYQGGVAPRQRGYKKVLTVNYDGPGRGDQSGGVAARPGMASYPVPHRKNLEPRQLMSWIAICVHNGISAERSLRQYYGTENVEPRAVPAPKPRYTKHAPKHAVQLPQHGIAAKGDIPQVPNSQIEINPYAAERPSDIVHVSDTCVDDGNLSPAEPSEAETSSSDDECLAVLKFNGETLPPSFQNGTFILDLPSMELGNGVPPFHWDMAARAQYEEYEEECKPPTYTPVSQAGDEVAPVGSFPVQPPIGTGRLRHHQSHDATAMAGRYQAAQPPNQNYGPQASAHLQQAHRARRL